MAPLENFEKLMSSIVLNDVMMKWGGFVDAIPKEFGISRAGFRHVVAPGQPSVVEAHPTLEY